MKSNQEKRSGEVFIPEPLDDWPVPGAAAEVPLQRQLHVVALQLGLLAQHRAHGHHHAWRDE